MVKKSAIILGIFLILSGISFGQTTGWVEDFNDGNISRWTVGDGHDVTYKLSAESGALKINYARTAGHEWDNMNYTPASSIDISKQPVISLRIKSTLGATLSVKPVFENGTDNYMSVTIKGDQSWQAVTIKLTASGTLKMNKMYMYINGGSSSVESGSIYIDEFRFGDSALTVMDWTALDRAIASTEALLLNTKEGTAQGEFPSGSKSVLQTALNSAKSVRTSGTKDAKLVSKSVDDLYNACSTFESKVNGPTVGITDPLATKETRHLYLNLMNLTKRALLFGMQDVTGYGVGWTGDDDRSDIKSVVGDYPALYSEDINTIERNGELERQRYRIVSAYNRGGVTTFVWHQNDPQNRGFYNTDVNNERIVAQLLPGGASHEYYKTKLRNIASFMKSLRGKNGETIPVIFRPYHEHVGNWFWWGPAYTTTQEYNSIWQFTVNYLRDSCNVHSALWAISPSLDLVNKTGQYFNVYPGDKYVDIFGADYYFGSTVSTTDKSTFLANLKMLAGNAISRSKVVALTEVGQESLPTTDWFTNTLLPPFKTDSVASNIIYAAVWRNANTTHHYAPYPGHPTAPDFVKFYNDSYTMFEKDLPNMYAFPEADKTAPLFVNYKDSVQVAVTTPVAIKLETNEKAFLRYSFTDESYSTMPYKFDGGEGSLSHTAYVSAKQGDMKTIYVRAADLFGNITGSSLAVRFAVDTLQRPVAWTDPLYAVNSWTKGPAPIGTGASAVTKSAPVRTVYFKSSFNLTTLPKALGILIKVNGGAAVTLNNYEIGRLNLPAGAPLTFDTDPSASGVATKIYTLDTTALKQLTVGRNTLAVEVHAPSQSSVDGFDCRVFDDKYFNYIALGSEWNYFDKGYRPADIKLRDVTSVESERYNVPAQYTLYGNYPNPFNPSTVIRYDLPKNSDVKIEVFDIIGRKVATVIDQNQGAGRYELRFDGSRLSSGIYILRMKADAFYQVHKMMLIK
ncbi:MAG: glycosyl hydrolase [Syntrophothermus sp.]